MSNTLTIRLSPDLAAWLQDAARRAGVPQGKIVRDQLEKARASDTGRGFMRLAGAVGGAETDLSARKGFTR